ncbi:MAG: NAD(P)H-dependent oxidoreductase [Candidatus Omnitrophica bacterium]|nr:NAD(P)H-dependent oxidoreductase [Candidatus Omnitrophota bacterium]
MRIAIIYYSYTGNTRKVAEVLAEFLRLKGGVTVVELKAQDESASFLGQCRRALVKARAKIAPLNLNFSEYDLICLGTPVWAFGPAPAINTFLDSCRGLENKRAVVFTTYGSGAGNKHCLSYLKNALLKKGIKECSQFSVQQFKVADKEFVLANIKAELRLWPNG